MIELHVLKCYTISNPASFTPLLGGICMTNEDYQKIFHEIKNHIAFINSSLQLIEKSHPEIKEFAYWNDSMLEISSLKRMLIELNAARLSSDLTMQKTSLKQFLPELAHSCTAAFQSKDFGFQIDLEPALPELEIDPDWLKRALFNLIKNAFEAMGGAGTINLAACLDGSFVRLDITDFGGGISPEYLPKLFTPFATTKPGGTGLGLLIARQIVESHKGRLTVESRPQEGCTFSAFLPIPRA